jgi:hypothetical protein
MLAGSIGLERVRFPGESMGVTRVRSQLQCQQEMEPRLLLRQSVLQTLSGRVLEKSRGRGRGKWRRATRSTMQASRCPRPSTAKNRYKLITQQAGTSVTSCTACTTCMGMPSDPKTQQQVEAGSVAGASKTPATPQPKVHCGAEAARPSEGVATRMPAALVATAEARANGNGAAPAFEAQVAP